MNTLVYVWLGLMILFLIIEAIVPGLISIWLAIGALVAIVPAALQAPLWLQILIFVLVSVISLVLTRPLAKKYVNSRKQPTNADAVIGKECLVTEQIDNVRGTGAVKTGGKIWTAVSSKEDVIIEQGSMVKAKEIKGVKLVVEPLKKKE